jgi:membrane fusion protein (multidrug efflux system)
LTPTRKKPRLRTGAVLALVTLVALAGPGCRGGADEEAAAPTDVAVHVGKVTRETLRAWVSAYGVVEPEPPGVRPTAGARVSPSTPGVVTRVACAEGQRVEKGQLLFQLDPRTADVAAEKARHAAEYARTTLERQRKLIDVEGTSRRQLLEAEQAVAAAESDLRAAETQQALLRVVAPLAGTVARIAVKAGDGVDLTTTLAEIVNLDRLVVSAGVPSAELGPLRAGQAAEVRGDEPSAVIAGTVASIRPEVDPATGTALVRVAVPPGSGLRPGQLVTVRIASEERKDRLTVPAVSVVKDAQGREVIALVANGVARQVPVKSGLRDGGRAEVEGEGLREGLTVVTEGAYALPAETKVHVLAP